MKRRPRRWWIYTLIVLLLAVILGWSSSAIDYKGIAAKGSEVAYGIIYGIAHPDPDLLFTFSVDGVPYLLLETVAIRRAGHADRRAAGHPLQLSGRRERSAQMGGIHYPRVHPDDPYHSKPGVGAGMDTRHRSRAVLRRGNAKRMLHRHDLQNVYQTPSRILTLKFWKAWTPPDAPPSKRFDTASCRSCTPTLFPRSSTVLISTSRTRRRSASWVRAASAQR